MALICEFCNHEFANQSNLATHKKTAKYCISLRGKSTPAIYKCKICDKFFTRQSTLTRHAEGCSERMSSSLKKLLEEKEIEIEETRAEIKEQRAEIEELKDSKASLAALNKKLETENIELKLKLAENKGEIKVYKEHPRTINNNQYINPKLLTIQCDKIPPLTIENIKKEVTSGKYTYDRYIRGETGLVDFIASIISEDDQRNYVCTDTARNKFHRLIETRDWENDNGATFINKILDQLKEPATIYHRQIIDMSLVPSERDLGDILMDRTKPMFNGISNPKSKDRLALFNRIRTEVRKLAAI